MQLSLVTTTLGPHLPRNKSFGTKFGRYQQSFKGLLMCNPSMALCSMQGRNLRHIELRSPRWFCIDSSSVVHGSVWCYNLALKGKLIPVYVSMPKEQAYRK